MNFFSLIVKNYCILYRLIKSDFKSRYVGNHLGIIWAFIQPLVMVLVYWFVFTKGLKFRGIAGVPFLLWLLVGMVPWFLMNEVITSTSSSITSQSFLVKKMVFEVKLLPIIKLGSSFMVNMAFWVLLLVTCLAYGYYPKIIWLQLIYYLLSSIILSFSIGYLCASIMPFFIDVGQIIMIVLQVLFWGTPVMWDVHILHGKFMYISKLNPFAYIVNGFRETIINEVPFWVHYNQAIYFWVFVILLFLISNKIFERLKPHFSDVL